jgi:uncharacterized protein
MKLFVVIACLLTSLNLTAQRIANSIQVISKTGDDGVWLRWAPTQYETWKSGNSNGYHIDRFTIQPGGTIGSSTPLRLTTTPVRAATLAEFERLGATQKETAAVGELIYKFVSNAPKGNHPAALLQQKEESEHRFGMALLLCDMNYRTAEAAGLFFKDMTAKKGERYIYKIAVNINPEPLDPGIIVVDVKDQAELKGFSDVTIKFGNKTATLRWPTITHKGVYTAYIIERSKDNKLFTSVTDLPYMNLVSDDSMDEAHYVDSLDANKTPYYYRVIGLTPFGEKSPPSNIVSGEGKDDMTGMIVITGSAITGKKTTSVKWNFPPAMETRIEGFVVSIANKSQGPYRVVTNKILSKKDREFDLGALTSSCYIQVKAVAKSGDELSQSFPWFIHIEDNNPPAAPTGIKGTIKDSQISLTWIANKETDIEGYRVFSSHSEKSEYVEVTKSILSTPAFVETLSAGEMNKKIWIKVVAVDQSFNISPYSAPITLSLPDAIAPTAPVFTIVTNDDKKIKLEWIPGYGNDVVRHTLTRSSREDTAWIRLKDFSKKDDPQFSDNNLTTGTIYKYKISAFDSAGNSASVVSKDVAFGGGVKKSVTDLTAFINRDTKVVKLTWKYSHPAKKVLIYRMKNDEKISLYQQLDGSISEFEDKLIQINNKYTYRIQMVIDHESRTELSEELKVQL